MNNILHIIYIPFTDVGINDPFQGKEWLVRRIRVFKEYTLKSLLNQTNKDFVLWMSFTPKEKENPLVTELREYIDSKGIKVIFTYNGLMYWDDKFGGNIFQKGKNFLRIFRRCYRNKKFDRLIPLIHEWRNNEKKNETLLIRLEESLKELIFTEKYISADYVYLTRLDSDDMLHKEAVRAIQAYNSSGAITLKSGYVYNKATDDLAEWNPLTNPPFHTIIFPVEVFFNAEKYLRHYQDFKSHEDIPRIFPHIQLQKRLFCVLIHSRENQISTIWNHKFRGPMIPGDKAEQIKKEFGI